MTDASLIVHDERGGELRLDTSLGRGGQGEVWAVSGGQRAVKLLNDASPARQELLGQQLRRVRRLPLDGLPIARPQLLLALPHVGYVMTLAEDMTSLRELMFPAGRRDVVDWFVEGGGLRRRLGLLARAADVLAELHGRGIAYGDPSPNNILVSKDVGHSEVFLIDTDNLTVTSRPGLGVYTPFYGAPEVVRNETGVSTLSDAHAFAVLAFETLTLTHPVIGDVIAEGAPELEADALSGRVPWIDDPTSAQNRSSSGFPRECVLTRRLRELAGVGFGVGLNNPVERPGVSAWAQQLHHAEDLAISCASCRSTYYGTALECVWCGNPRGPIAVLEFLLDHGFSEGTTLQPTRTGAVFLRTDECRQVPGRLATGRTSDDTPVLEVTLQKSKVVVRNLAQRDLIIQGAQQKHELPTGKELGIPTRSSARLLFGDPSTIHRFAVIRGVDDADR